MVDSTRSKVNVVVVVSLFLFVRRRAANLAHTLCARMEICWCLQRQTVRVRVRPETALKCAEVLEQRTLAYLLVTPFWARPETFQDFYARLSIQALRSSPSACAHSTGGLVRLSLTSMIVSSFVLMLIQQIFLVCHITFSAAFNTKPPCRLQHQGVRSAAQTCVHNVGPTCGAHIVDTGL